MTKRPYVGPSEAQSNADALARRGLPFTEASRLSFEVKWDWHRREPADLRDAVRMARRAYADEVPTNLHEGPDDIGVDGTPKMTARAEGYIFGSATSSDVTMELNEAGKRVPADFASYYHAPFRATLDRLSKGVESERKRAAIVTHVTIGGQNPGHAAMTEGVPAWCAKTVAEDALRAFLRSMTDLKLHLSREPEAA
jgi:hypothetical protein